MCFFFLIKASVVCHLCQELKEKILNFLCSLTGTVESSKI